MASRKVNQMASAIVRRINTGARGAARRGSLPGAVASAVASRLASPRGATRGRPSSKVASVSGGRLGARGAQGGVNLDALASRLASAVASRLATPGGAPARSLSVPRMASAITRRVASSMTEMRQEPIHVKTLDAAAAAGTVAAALTDKSLRAADPAMIVASSVLRRLGAARVAGSIEDAKAFQQRVASIVIQTLNSHQQAEAAAATGTEAAVVAEAAPAAAAEPTTRKRAT